MNPVPKEELELEQLVDFDYDYQVGSVAIIETSTGSALGRGATDTDALRDALITVTNRRDPNMDFGSRRWLSRRYGIPAAKAAQITPEIRAQVEDWREQNGLPATSSPLTRGYLLDLLAKENAMHRNPRGIYHGTEAGKNDFVIHEHRGAFWVDLVFAGGTHLNISPARGYRDLDEALEGIADAAHTRSIRRYNIFRQDDVAGEMRMIGNPRSPGRPRWSRPGWKPLMPLDASYYRETIWWSETKAEEPYGIMRKDGRWWAILNEEFRELSGEDFSSPDAAADRAESLNQSYIPNPHRPPPPRPVRRPLPRPTRQPASVLSSVRQIVHREERAPFDPERRYARETKPHHFAVNRRRPRRNAGSDSRDQIVKGAARAFFVSAWADAAEEVGHSFRGGTRIDEVAPPTPPEVLKFARRFIRKVESLNDRSIDTLYDEHAEAAESLPDPEEFGFYIAMPAMGHGTHWYDHYPVPPSGEIKLPSVEFYVSVDPDDIDEASIDFSEIG